MITAEELNVQIGPGFGYSLSKEISDADNNGLDDFAVGAPFGESVVVLRSRPVISFRPAVMLNPSYDAQVIDPENNVAEYIITFQITTYSWTQHYSRNVYARFDLKHDDRIEFNKFQEQFKITNDDRSPGNGITHREYLTFKAKEPKFGIDLNSPDEPKPIWINLKVSYDVDSCQSGTSLLKCPMLAPKVAERVEDLPLKLDIRTGCAQREICRCNLKFSLKEPKSYEVRVGEQKGLDLEFVVTNEDYEPAYGVTIVFQSFVNFPIIHGPRGTCKPYNGTDAELGFVTECSLPKIAKFEEIHRSFRFHFPSDFEGQSNFNIIPVLKHSCYGRNPEMLEKQYRLFELKFETKIELTSSVSSSQIV